MIKRIAHVGIATGSISDAAPFYELMGLQVDSVELVEEQKVRVAVLSVGESALELLEATDRDSSLARFIEKRGEGMHHITFEVEDLPGALGMLRSQNISLIDEQPRKGAGGKLIAFVHPRSTGGVLIELSQSPKGVD
jgi:methylmalonyl-CoA/ethylmalonyl-CoA epimerase